MKAQWKHKSEELKIKVILNIRTDSFEIKHNDRLTRCWSILVYDCNI